MFDENGEIECSGNKHPGRLRATIVLLVSIAAIAVPILIARMSLYDEDGISKNALLTQLILPGIWSALVLLVIALFAWTRATGDPNIIWYRWTRVEVILAVLFIFIITAVYPLLGILVRKLGLPSSPGLMFRADQRGLAFFVSLTILTAIIGPVVEEIFWRGCVQRTLERILGGLGACLVQAVPFAAYHVVPIGGFAQVCVFGLFMGAWRWRRRTLLPIILTHIAINSLWCAARWPGWMDCTRVRATTNYVAEFIEISKPPGYDPNDDAREEYTKASQLIIRFPKVFAQVRKRYPTQWTRKKREQVEAWLISNEEALNLVEKATQKPYYWVEYEPQNERMPPLEKNLDKMRDFVFALCMRAMLRTAEGRHDEGLGDIETCYKLGRHLVANGEMICRLAGYGARAVALETSRIILAHEVINSSLLANFQNRLEEFAKDDALGFDFTAERLLAKDAIQCIFTDNGQGGGHVAQCAFKTFMFSGGKIESTLSRLPVSTESDIKRWRKLERRKTTAQVEEYYDLCEEVCSQLPWQYRGTSFLRIRIEMLQMRNPFIKMLSPGIENLVAIAGRARVDRDATIAIMAILRFKDDTKQLPETLSELVDAGYLKEVPADSFSVSPLSYCQTGDDFILYSFGADFDDDGGTPSKWGEGENGGDQVFWPVQTSDANVE